MDTEEFGGKWDKKIISFFKNETLHFLVGFAMLILATYFLISSISFFFTGAADQSLVDGGEYQVAIC